MSSITTKKTKAEITNESLPISDSASGLFSKKITVGNVATEATTGLISGLTRKVLVIKNISPNIIYLGSASVVIGDAFSINPSDVLSITLSGSAYLIASSNSEVEILEATSAV
jgi:hypothetical protein